MIRILNLLRRIRFKSPERNEVLVFDKEGSFILERTILGNISHTILEVRFEIFYSSLPIAMRLIINLCRTGFKSLSFHAIRSQIYRLYLLSCVEYIKPRVVMTWVDDSRAFHYISLIYKNAEFFAVSNGFRYEYPAVIPENGYKISMPHYICYGQFEVDLYKKYGHQIKNYHPVGPVIGSYFKTELSNNAEAFQFDLCLVSQCEPTIVEGAIYPEIRKAITKLNEFLIRYIAEYGVKLRIALRSTDIRERHYFESLYGNTVTMTQKEDNWLATYEAMEQSETVVVFDSTAAVEAYGWGKKVLFTNYSGTDRYKIPVSEACFTSEADYIQFRNKLNKIRAMTTIEYRELTATNRKYIVNYDPLSPAHIYVRRLVLEALR